MPKRVRVGGHTYAVARARLHLSDWMQGVQPAGNHVGSNKRKAHKVAGINRSGPSLDEIRSCTLKGNFTKLNMATASQRLIPAAGFKTHSKEG
jgi:hypothetical protein